jgi:hypothetical protein
MRTRRPGPTPIARSAFAASASHPRSSCWRSAGTYALHCRIARRGAACRTRDPGRPRHHLPVGAAVHAAAGRGRPALPPCRRGSLAGGRDLRESRRPVALRLPCDRPDWPGHRRVRLPSAGRGGTRRPLGASLSGPFDRRIPGGGGQSGEQATADVLKRILARCCCFGVWRGPRLRRYLRDVGPAGFAGWTMTACGQRRADVGDGGVSGDPTVQAQGLALLPRPWDLGHGEPRSLVARDHGAWS